MRHVTRAMHSGKEHSTTSLGMVSEANAARVQRETGYAISGHERLIQSSEVRHVFRSHGDQAIEAARGQIAVRKSDFIRITEIVEQAETIDAIGKPKSVKPLRLEYRATLDSHEYRYVEEIPPGKIVALKSLRKRAVGGARRE